MRLQPFSLLFFRGTLGFRFWAAGLRCCHGSRRLFFESLFLKQRVPVVEVSFQEVGSRFVINSLKTKKHLLRFDISAYVMTPTWWGRQGPYTHFAKPRVTHNRCERRKPQLMTFSPSIPGRRSTSLRTVQTLPAVAA